MIISIITDTTRLRRQRWTFTLAPVAHDDPHLTFILSEYSVETSDDGSRWVRPKHNFYRRRNGPEALMKVDDVPDMSDATRRMLIDALARNITFAAQSNSGLIRI